MPSLGRSNRLWLFIALSMLAGVLIVLPRLRQPHPVAPPHPPGQVTSLPESTAQPGGPVSAPPPPIPDGPLCASDTPPGPIRPKIPSPLSEPTIEVMKQYLMETWLLSSVEAKKRIDAELANRGPLAALSLIARTIAEGGATSDPSFRKDHPDHRIVGEEGLRSFDFEHWFRRLQFVKLIPYVAARAGTSEVNALAKQLVLDILEAHTDDVLALFAASCLSDPKGAFSEPQFLESYSLDDTPLGIGFSFSGPDRYRRISGGEDSNGAFEAFRQNLLPSLANDPDATARVAAIIDRVTSRSLRSHLLDAVAQMADKERYSLVFLRLATNPDLDSTTRGKAIDLVKGLAHIQSVREAFDSAIRTTDPNARSARVLFIDRIPECYPTDERYSRTLSELVGNEHEDALVRSAAAKALLKYPVEGMSPSGAVTTYLSSLEAADNWGGFSDVAQAAAQLGRRELVPLFREILARYESDGSQPHRVTALRAWLATLLQ